MPIVVNDSIILDDREVEERFVRASGPGGQNVNKVATAVELRFDVRASSLPPAMQSRVIALAGNRLVSGDVVLIDSREYRTQAQNRVAARERLIALLQQAATPPKRRRPTRPKASAALERLESKKRRSSVKELRGRGRYRDE